MLIKHTHTRTHIQADTNGLTLSNSETSRYTDIHRHKTEMNLTVTQNRKRRQASTAGLIIEQQTNQQKRKNKQTNKQTNKQINKQTNKQTSLPER